MRAVSRVGVAVVVATALTVLLFGTGVGTAAPGHRHGRHHHHGGGLGSILTLTEADAGATVSLPAGQTLGVVLHGSPTFRFSAPVTSDASVLARLGSSEARSTGDANGTFEGEHIGAAELSSTQDPSCFPQCLAPSRLWRVTVEVVPEQG